MEDNGMGMELNGIGRMEWIKWNGMEWTMKHQNSPKGRNRLNKRMDLCTVAHAHSMIENASKNILAVGLGRSAGNPCFSKGGSQEPNSRWAFFCGRR